MPFDSNQQRARNFAAEKLSRANEILISFFHSGEKSREKFRGNEKFSAAFVVSSARESRRVLPNKTAFA